MDWTQNYDPLNSAFASTLLAAAPIVVLLGLFVAGTPAHRAALAGLLTALVVAMSVYGMPTEMALAAAAYGACFGLVPIGWIVVAAVFLFQLTVRAGQFEVLKRSVAALSPDRRVQALLIAFCFGAFIEGAAGFGTPVAISAALLIGLGFSPLYAAGLSLIANTSPVAFGALGTPIITLARTTGLDEMALSQMAGRQLPLFSLIVPVWLVATMSGWQGVKGCWPALVTCGGTFATIQFLMSNYHGPTLVDVAGGLGTIGALVVLLRFWQPKTVWRFPDEPGANDAAIVAPSRAESVRAWLPWLLLSVFVFLWGWPPIKSLLTGLKPADSAAVTWRGARVSVPYLDGHVYRTAPVAPVKPGTDRAEKPEEAVYELNWFAATGTGIFLAAVVSRPWLGVSVPSFIGTFLGVLVKMRLALVTIACMLAVAFVTKYCGSDATLGLAFTKTGPLYPFFAPLLGWLGVALTGSDTSSNALFGNLQRITAEQLGQSPVLMAASNSTGGVMGKMIDAQSIVVAAVATGRSGDEGTILKFVFWHSIVLAALVGVVTLLQAYVLTGMVP